MTLTKLLAAFVILAHMAEHLFISVCNKTFLIFEPIRSTHLSLPVYSAVKLDRVIDFNCAFADYVFNFALCVIKLHSTFII